MVYVEMRIAELPAMISYRLRRLAAAYGVAFGLVATRSVNKSSQQHEDEYLWPAHLF
jgi:hypothetical protein